MDTQTIRIPTEQKKRLEGMRTHPRQPIYEVIEQLLRTHHNANVVVGDDDVA